MNNRFELPFKENYQSIDGVRLHYVDEEGGNGKSSGDLFYAGYANVVLRLLKADPAFS